jgi:uncharacterized protein YjdB
MTQHMHASTRSVASTIRPLLLTLGITLIALLGCADGRDASAPDAAGRAKLSLRASYAGAVAYSAPINRIRLTISMIPSGQTLIQTFPDLDPTDDSWDLGVEFDLEGTTHVEILAELINFANGIEKVEYSGKLPLFAVSAGDNNAPPNALRIFPGPPENLTITSVEITAPNRALTEGDQYNLLANVQGGASNTTVLWTSLDPTIATVNESGQLSALLPGTARIVAAAGPRADTLPVAITGRVERVAVTPPTLTVTSLGAPADFTAQAFDPRNAPVTGSSLVWSISDPSIAEEVAPGRYRSRARGQATITAALQSNPSVRGTATLIVQQTATRMTLTPPSAQVTASGVNTQFTATVFDANSSPIANPTVQWSSSNQAVATVDNSGVATSRGVGRTTITADAGNGIRATATLDVSQTIARIELVPSTWHFTKIGDQHQFVATVYDTNDQPVPAAEIIWGLESQGPVVEVTTTGLVTAVGSGSARITVTSGTVRAEAAVTVGSLSSGLSLEPQGPIHVSNCIPFGNNTSYGFVGFIYRNVPAFTVNPGDRIAFDLGSLNNIDIRREIYFSAANKNPQAAISNSPPSQGIQAVNWVRVVSEAQTPLNPRGDQTVGNYELVFTAEASFSFAGGGFLVGFAGSPPATNADGNCEQTLVSATFDDPSNVFYMRFHYHQHLTTAVLDVPGFSDGQALGGIRILTAQQTLNSARVIIPNTRMQTITKPVTQPVPMPRVPGAGPGKEPPPPVRRPPSNNQ